VTVLMPGATETEFFERTDMMDAKVGASGKDDQADVAKTGFDAMMDGESEPVAGWKNKAIAAVSNLLSDTTLAEQHRAMAEPGSARQTSGFFRALYAQQLVPVCDIALRNGGLLRRWLPGVGRFHCGAAFSDSSLHFTRGRDKSPPVGDAELLESAKHCGVHARLLSLRERAFLDHRSA